MNFGTCAMSLSVRGQMIKKTGCTIVVVDSDTNNHNLIRNFFESKDFTVVCYNNASIALKESLVAGKSWDVLLTDYHFSDMLAVEFTKRIKENLPLLPVILITPLELAETALSAIEEGAYDFIAKPIHFGQLQVAVSRALKVKNLIDDNSELRKILKYTKIKSSDLEGRSPLFLAAVDTAKRVSKSAASVLLSGESGTGKEVFANFIHNNSKQSGGPFTAINCASIPENLLESELFGHAKGSFTGAFEKRVGLFEAAENGTLFLDEIGDLSLQLQSKLLRVLQEKKIKRVGENKPIAINCRIISATHKDLVLEIKEGRFREDLFYRLNVIPIVIPPLRDRHEDLLPLAETFLKKFALANESSARMFSKEAIKFILENSWKGNVRELENTVERAVVMSSGTEILLENFIPLKTTPLKSVETHLVHHSEENIFSFRHQAGLPKLDEVISKYIEYAILKNSGAKDKAAKEIGIDRKTLYRRMQSEIAK